MPTFRILYIPKGIVGPTGSQLGRHDFYAIDSRHAAKRAAAFERRSRNLVLTVKEVKQ